MDYFGTDRKLSELGEQDLEDFLDQDMFTPPCSDSGMDQCIEQFGLDTCDAPMDNKWLDEFFDDPVLNDRMMTDALQPRRVQSEHSYSLTNGEKIIIDGQIKPEVTEKDLEVDLLGSAINPNMTLVSATATTIVNTPHITTTHTCTDNGQMMETVNYTDPTQTCSSAQVHIKNEPIMSTDEITMATNSITPVPVPMTTRPHVQPHPQTLLKQPTIILATQQQHSPHTDVNVTSMAHPRQERYVLPKMDIKTEQLDTASIMSSPEHATMYDSIGLPPTPPSSSNSDSEGSVSPQRSAPPSPIRHSQMLRQHVHTQHTLGGASAALAQQPLFSSPIPTSGVLILSEEEKRTLVAEGYPIPNKLPLTKQEEKNLKKIRRKIKNKISAQESRRKKKEYLETLEKKVEAYNSENCDLKKKVEQLENNNRSLIGQLQKLQSLVAKVPRPSSPATQTGTCLMVLVLFFAVFMGTWSPMTWSIGYGSAHSSGVVGQPLNPVSPVFMSSGPLMGPEIQEPVSDPYSTPNMRSRVLLSVKEDLDEHFGPQIPFSYKDFFMRWFSVEAACPGNDDAMETEKDYSVAAPLPNIDAEEEDATVFGHMPDMAANYTAQVLTAPSLNTTA